MFSFLVSRNAETYGNITAAECWQRLFITELAAAYKRHEAQGSTCACRLGLLNGAPIVERKNNKALAFARAYYIQKQPSKNDKMWKLWKIVESRCMIIAKDEKSVY